MKKINTHPTQTHARELADICHPLKQLNITYFAHARINDKGQFAALNNHPEFMRYYLSKHYYNADIHMARESQLANYVLWDNVALDSEGENLKREAIAFGVDHTFTLIEKNALGMQYYHFSTNLKNESFNQEYFRHFDLLKHFIMHFNEQVTSSKHLSSAYSTTFSLTENPTTLINECRTLTARERFLQQLNIKNKHQYAMDLLNQDTKKYLSTRYQHKLSPREIDCLALTVQGKTAKLIASALAISRRTVEEHIASIKTKLNAYSKSDLIEKVIENHTSTLL